MDTIKQVKQTGGQHKPYPRAMMAKIIKMKETEKALELSLADHTDAIKCVAYGDVCQAFHPGDVLLFRQFQRGASGVLLVNKHTHIRKCPPLKELISDEILTLANRLVDPPMPPVASISSIHQEKTSNPTVTVQGRIIHVRFFQNTKCSIQPIIIIIIIVYGSITLTRQPEH